MKRLAVLVALIGFGAGCGPTEPNDGGPHPHVCVTVNGQAHHDVPCTPHTHVLQAETS